MKLSVTPMEPKVEVKADVNEVEALIDIYLERTRPKQETRPVGWFEYQTANRRSRPKM